MGDMEAITLLDKLKDYDGIYDKMTISKRYGNENISKYFKEIRTGIISVNNFEGICAHASVSKLNMKLYLIRIS